MLKDREIIWDKR